MIGWYRNLRKSEHQKQDDVAVHTWLLQPRLQDLLELEQYHLRKLLPSLFGYRLLQLGCWGYSEEFVEQTPMPRHWILGIRHDITNCLTWGEFADHSLTNRISSQAISDGQSLPVANKSVDAVLLPHSLEVVRSPHKLLREVDRVLCDHGHVLIAGFNPFSGWGLRRLWPWGEMRPPKVLHGYPVSRVEDWLELLDFEIIETRRVSSGFPWLRGDGKDHRLHLLRRLMAWCCPVYVMVARKRVVPVTPVMKPAWRRSAVVSPIAVPEARQQAFNPARRKT